MGREFTSPKKKFKVTDLTLNKAKDSASKVTDRPGVYLFWKDGEVIRVGRHFENARKRALEHIRDDTGGEMMKLNGDANAHLLLFTVNKEKDKHWIAALEIFFERKLTPKIPQKRQG